MNRRPPFDVASSRIPRLPPARLQSGIRELRWCREELQNFDVLSVDDRADPRIVGLERAIEDALLGLFDRKSPEFQRFRRDSLVDNASFSLAYPTPIHEIRQGLRAGLDDTLERLTEAIEALETGLAIVGAAPDPPPARARAAGFFRAKPEIPPPPAPPLAEPDGSRSVYVVASRSAPARMQLVNFLSAVDLEPVTLDGAEGVAASTMEDEARRAAFAVVLVTPEDIRTLNDPQTAPDFRPCASQEVIFGLGFVVGAMGADRVCTLVCDKAELPFGGRDATAVVMDAAEGWKLVLAKRIKAAGVPIDLNRAI